MDGVWIDGYGLMNYVNTTLEDGICHISLNAPDKRNALGLEMFNAIDDALQQVNCETRCVLLCGEGSVFCSGFDMVACVDDLAVLEQYILRLSSLIRSLRRLRVPVVVAAHGAAIAGGCALLTGCDFIVGSATGKIWIPRSQTRYFPCCDYSYALSKTWGG